MSDIQKEIVEVDKKELRIKIGEGLEKYLQNPLLWFAETATGAAMYDKKDFILAGGQLIQGAIKLDLWGEMLNQLKKARVKGKTKEKFYESRNGRINFNELFSYLDNSDAPDEEVFKALKAIFFASEELRSEYKDEILAYQLIKLTKQLKSVDLLVLMAAYKLYLKQKKGEKSNIHTIQAWQIEISKMIGLPIDMIVDSRIKYHGTQEATNPSLFLVNDNMGEEGITNMGLNASAIALGEFISRGNEILSTL